MTKEQTVERIHAYLDHMEPKALEGLLHFLEALPEGGETTYLLSNPVNAERLLTAVGNIEKHQNLSRQ